VTARVRVLTDAEALADAAARHFAELARAAIAATGRFAVVLAGGATPARTYERLALGEMLSPADWERVHVFWGDERRVPPEHEDSNYRMARETLLDRVPIPARNVRRIRGEADPRQAATDYEQALREFFGAGSAPRFDLVLLGMGEDGHTASLFPGTDGLREGRRWVVAHYVEKLGAWRVTLTLAVINAAAEVVLLVSGAGKAERLREVLEGSVAAEPLPARAVRPTAGRLVWLVDAAAASLLGGEGAARGEDEP